MVRRSGSTASAGAFQRAPPRRSTEHPLRGDGRANPVRLYFHNVGANDQASTPPRHRSDSHDSGLVEGESEEERDAVHADRADRFETGRRCSSSSWQRKRRSVLVDHEFADASKGAIGQIVALSKSGVMTSLTPPMQHSTGRAWTLSKAPASSEAVHGCRLARLPELHTHALRRRGALDRQDQRTGIGCDAGRKRLIPLARQGWTQVTGVDPILADASRRRARAETKSSTQALQLALAPMEQLPNTDRPASTSSWHTICRTWRRSNGHSFRAAVRAKPPACLTIQ